MSDYMEELRKQYNAAIANGLWFKARMIDHRMKALENRSE